MFICPRTQNSVLSLKYMPTLDYIGKNHGIQVANMRGSIDIEYRCGDVVRFLNRGLGGDKPSTAIAINSTGRLDPW